MERVSGNSPVARTEELLRLLAAAANAVRLYPESSQLRDEAVTRFANAGRALAAQGTVQLRVDRERFLLGDVGIGSPGTAVGSLAESLHALQIGQLIVAPGVTPAEAAAFLGVLGVDSKALRASGGMRKALVEAGVSNIAVVEVTLRASTEEGLAGLDLTAAPLDEIGSEVAAAAGRWADAVATGGPGTDEMAIAIDNLEAAAQDLASRRVAEALLHLDEASRIRIMEAALAADSSGARMDGMLDAIAKMPPAALARLLRLVADQSDTDASSLLGALEIPPEVARELAVLLRPSPQSDSERGVPEAPDVPGIVADVAESDEGDQLRIEALMREYTPANVASRALSTTLQVTQGHPTDETVQALGDAMRASLRVASYEGLGGAFAVLQDLGRRPELATAVSAVRAPLVEQIIDAYSVAPEGARDALASQLARMSESVGPVAGRVLREGDPTKAAAVVRLIATAGDKRLMPLISQALDHLDISVRTSAITALADAHSVESTALLQRALTHWDPETRRIAAREIGRGGFLETVPAMLRILEEVYLFERNYELKKEVLNSLGILRPTQAIPVLTRLGGRRLVIGKKNRELRYRARQTLKLLQTASTDEGVRST
ncbi:MAG: HEAT repeat domain-containing protein [Coriobacteriia bacterium]